MSASLKKYEVTEAIRELPELVNRVQQGEEILLTENGRPVARLTGLIEPQGRRSKIVRALLTDKEIKELSEAVEAPLSPRDQRILEGEGTDDVGIWIGLQEPDQRVPQPDTPD